MEKLPSARLGDRSDNVVLRQDAHHVSEEEIYWSLREVERDRFLIRSWEGDCLDIYNSSKDNGANLQVFQECHEGKNQQFEIKVLKD